MKPERLHADETLLGERGFVFLGSTDNGGSDQLTPWADRTDFAVVHPGGDSGLNSAHRSATRATVYLGTSGVARLVLRRSSRDSIPQAIVSPMKARLVSILYLTALVICSSTLGLLLVEAALRAGGYTPRALLTVISGWDRVRSPFPGGGYLHRGHETYTQTWPSDPQGYFDGPDHQLTYRLNNFGFRGRDFSIRRGRRVRIAVLGDSICFGHGVREEDILTERLARRLDREQPLSQEYEVLNFCLQGYNTQHEAILYEEVVARFRPDILLLVYYLNDVNQPPTRYFAWRREQPEWVTEARKRLYVFDVLAHGFESLRYRSEFLRNASEAYEAGHPAFQAVATGLDRLSKVASRDRVPRLLFVFPWLGDPGTDHYPFRAAHQAVAKAAEAIGFHVVDLLKVFDGLRARDLWVHPRDYHPNARAHELAADAIYDALLGVLDRSPTGLLEEVARRREDSLEPRLDQDLGRDWYGVFEALARNSQTPESNNG